jgi:riboflavin kinase/FMN adenylyltransferase
MDVEAGIYRNWTDLAPLRGKRVAMTLGIFDGIHRGHMQLFNLTRELAADASGLALIFTFRNHPLQVVEQGRDVQFITLPGEKVFLLRKLGFQHIACFDFDERFAKLKAAEFFSRLRNYCDLRVFVAGHDTTLGSDRLRNDEAFNKLARELNFEFIRVAAVTEGNAPISSRRIRGLLKDGDVAAANELLVYPFFVRGKVERGRGIGKAVLRVPTANILLPPEKLLPIEGVYAGSYHRDHLHYPAALVVVPADRKPNFVPDDSSGDYPSTIEPGTMLVEAHILDQEVSLYGRSVEFIFLSRLRDNRRFDIIQELQAQIAEDLQETRRAFDKSSLKLRFLP